jgi:pyruvate/2-oxoglutarate dehydrogenase complex dihydrolipoamide dehydrogenase (E3) component
MAEFDLDLLIIGGGGSGGFTAATTALKSGAKVGMVEAGRLGGLCILAGCMPSKSLLHDAADLFKAGTPGRDAYQQVIARKRGVVDGLAGNRVQAVNAKEKEGLIMYQGRARFVDPHTVEVDGQKISAASMVIATGSTEIMAPVKGLEEAGYLFSDGLMELERLPSSMAVLGGGTIALELSQYLTRMGVQVHIIQRSAHLLSKEDPRIGKLLEEALASEGVLIYTDTDIDRIKKGPQGKTVHFEHQGQAKEITVDEILVAFGRKPNSESLNLEAAGVETHKGAVKVDKEMRTNVTHIFAAGDVTGHKMVVNLAVLQGEIAGHNAISHEPKEIDDSILPWAIFTEPEVARVGLGPAECQDQGLDFVEADYELGQHGRGPHLSPTLAGLHDHAGGKGTGRILGADLVAPHASLMIHEVAVAMRLGGTAQDIADLPYIHPCLAELVNLCAYRLARMVKR